MEAYSSINYNEGAGPTSQLFGMAPNIVTPGPAWHWIYHPNGAAATAPTVSTMYLSPIFPGRPCTLTNLSYQITTQGTGSGTQVFRAGIYAADSTTGRPTGDALADFGTENLEATTGIKVWDITNFAMDPKLYWFGCVKQTSGTQSTVSAIRFMFQNSMNTIFMASETVTTPTNLDTNALGFQQTGVTGSLPTIDTLVSYQGAVPCVLFKFA